MPAMLTLVLEKIGLMRELPLDLSSESACFHLHQWTEAEGGPPGIRLSVEPHER